MTEPLHQAVAICAAYVSRTAVQPYELPKLIEVVHGALVQLDAGPAPLPLPSGVRPL